MPHNLTIDNDDSAFQASEAIARGENCPACGGRWTPDDHRPGARTLNHRGDCSYIAYMDAASS